MIGGGLNKDELIKSLTEKTKLSKDEVSDVLHLFTNEIKQKLTEGEKVVISNFGSFILSNRKAKVFINPRTGTKHQLPARVWPHFKASGKFKKAIREE